MEDNRWTDADAEAVIHRIVNGKGKKALRLLREACLEIRQVGDESGRQTLAGQAVHALVNSAVNWAARGPANWAARGPTQGPGREGV